jgi:transcriptional regulator with XRE-family HTH domain
VIFVNHKFQSRKSARSLAVVTSRETGALIRAALAYAGIKLTVKGGRQEVGGIGASTIERMMRGARTASLEELRAIALACDVPPQFLEVGFEPLKRPLSDVERDLYALREEHSALAARVAGLEGAKAPPKPTRLGARLKPVQAKAGAEPDAAPARPSESRHRAGSRSQDQDGPRTQPGSR